MEGTVAVCGSTREGMSANGDIKKAAYVADGSVVLMTAGAVKRNNLPPGFWRFLSDDEMEFEGIKGLVHNM